MTWRVQFVPSTVSVSAFLQISNKSFIASHFTQGFLALFLILSFIVVLYHVMSASQPRYWTGSVGATLGVRTAICWWDKSASRARDRWRHSGQATKKIAPRRQKTVRTPPMIQPCGNLMDMLKEFTKSYPLVFEHVGALSTNVNRTHVQHILKFNIISTKHLKVRLKFSCRVTEIHRICFPLTLPLVLPAEHISSYARGTPWLDSSQSDYTHMWHAHAHIATLHVQILAVFSTALIVKPKNIPFQHIETMRPFVGGREACPAVLYASLAREIFRGKICCVALDRIWANLDVIASFCHSEWYNIPKG